MSTWPGDGTPIRQAGLTLDLPADVESRLRLLDPSD